MTTRLPFTQQTLRRAIAAARKEGLHVQGIRPDGTLILGEKPVTGPSLAIDSADNAPPSKWEDVEA